MKNFIAFALLIAGMAACSQQTCPTYADAETVPAVKVQNENC